jgi:hypothetical protein
MIGATHAGYSADAGCVWYQLEIEFALQEATNSNKRPLNNSRWGSFDLDIQASAKGYIEVASHHQPGRTDVFFSPFADQ